MGAARTWSATRAGDRLTDYDLLQVPDWRRRNQLREELRVRRKVLEPALAAKARIFAQLNTEFLRRYGKQLGLQPLDAPYGGRPDYEPGVRSYPDGVPMMVWVFESRHAYQDYHVTHRGVSRALRYDHGYFEPSTAWITTYDSTARRRRRAGRSGRCSDSAPTSCSTGTRVSATGGQSPDWGQEFFGAGLAGDLSGVRVGEDLDLEFTDVDVDLLGDAQRIAASRASGGAGLSAVPAAAAHVDHHATPRRRGWARRSWASTGAALDLFFQQSWMFVLFLREYEDGRYREGFDRYLDAYMSRGTGVRPGGAGASALPRDRVHRLASPRSRVPDLRRGGPAEAGAAVVGRPAGTRQHRGCAGRTHGNRPGPEQRPGLRGARSLPSPPARQALEGGGEGAGHEAGVDALRPDGPRTDPRPGAIERGRRASRSDGVEHRPRAFEIGVERRRTSGGGVGRSRSRAKTHGTSALRREDTVCRALSLRGGARGGPATAGPRRGHDVPALPFPAPDTAVVSGRRTDEANRRHAPLHAPPDGGYDPGPRERRAAGEIAGMESGESGGSRSPLPRSRRTGGCAVTGRRMRGTRQAAPRPRPAWAGRIHPPRRRDS